MPNGITLYYGHAKARPYTPIRPQPSGTSPSPPSGP